MTWHSQRSLEWCTYLGRFWGALPWKMKVIHSVLSSSDVGEIEDSYVQSYIQTQSTGIACETLLMLQLLERWEKKDSLTAEGGNYSSAGLSINPRSPALRNVTSHCVRIKTASLVRLTWFKGDLKMRSGWIFIIVGWLCSHTANTHLCPNTM